MDTNKNILLWTVLFTISFGVAFYIFQPDKIEGFAFSLIGISWLAYMMVTFFSIIALTMIPYVKAMLQGEDEKYGVAERKFAIILISAIVIANAIFMSNIIPTILIAAYGTN